MKWIQIYKPYEKSLIFTSQSKTEKSKVSIREDLKEVTDSFNPVSWGRSLQSLRAMTANAPSPFIPVKDKSWSRLLVQVWICSCGWVCRFVCSSSRTVMFCTPNLTCASSLAGEKTHCAHTVTTTHDDQDFFCRKICVWVYILFFIYFF